jgi:pimeloyl-ACP methyl ester carboxylesterase
VTAPGGAEGVREQHTEVAGGVIRSWSGGDGPPVVVLHHSFGNPGWLPFHRELSERCTVVAPDLPGFGGSAQPAWARHPRDLALLMAWWLRAQEFGRVTLVGCGFGGWVAAELSTMSPELLAGLVLVAPAGLLPKDGRILDQVLVSHSEYVRAAFEDQKAFEAVYGADLTDDLLLSWDMNREMTTRVAWKPYMYNRRLPPLLAHVHVPALVVAAQSDRIMPRSCAEQYAALMPQARLEIVPNCGHAVDMEQPSVLAGLVAGHLPGAS